MERQVNHKFLQLQQQLATTEKKLKGATLIAAQYQARVLSLEDLIDDKNDVKEKAAKGIANEKEQQKNREMELHQDNEQLKQGNSDLRGTETRLISKIKDLRVVLREKGDAEMHNDPQMKEEPIESDEDNQISTRDVMEAEGLIKDEEVSNDDVLSRMSDADVKVEDCVDDPQFNPDNSTHGTSLPSDFVADGMDFDGDMNDDRDITVGDNDSLNHSSSIEDMNGTGQPEYEQEDSMADDLIEREEETEATTDIVMKSSDKTEGKKGRRSSRVACKPLQYKETDEDSEENDEPTRKKSKSEPEKKKENIRKTSTNVSSQSETGMKEPMLNEMELKCPKCKYHARTVFAFVRHLSRIHSTNARQAGVALRCACGVDCFTTRHFSTCKVANATIIKIDDKKKSLAIQNDTDLECPECEYRSKSAKGWRLHLSKTHSTNPALAGLVLRCDCGNESLSERHSLACENTNVVVVRKRYGPIRRIQDEKETPQCVLCEVYPATMFGFHSHLEKHHNTTLKKSGIYLKCLCDFKVTTRSSLDNHKQCDGRRFTLHKIDEE